jgi:hypothetical protein
MGRKLKNYTENYTDNYPELDGINNLVPKQQTIKLTEEEWSELNNGSKGSHDSTNISDTISQTEIEFAATNAWVEFNKKDSDDSESFYKGWELAIKWYTENKKD